MVEPTETETKENLDFYAEIMEKIIAEARSNPEELHKAPHKTPVSRPDEVRANRRPILKALSLPEKED